MGSKPLNLYRVKVQEWYQGKYPQARYDLVMAEDMSAALDLVADSLEEPNTLYDEPIQRDIADGVMNERTIERNYSGYIEQVDFVQP